MIGAGEVTAVKILRELFPQAEIRQQVKVKDLLKGDWEQSLSAREEKETVDILVEIPAKSFVVRIQDRHHGSKYMGQVDKIQRQILEWNNYSVIDVWFTECPYLFKDIYGSFSRDELVNLLKEADVL